MVQQENFNIDRKFHNLEKALRKKNIYAGFGGGIGKFGSNFNFLKYKEKTIWIDFGGGFPDENFPGMRRMLPNYIPAFYMKPSSIILTHGHEDHIGAIPYFYSSIAKGTVIYGTNFTLELLKEKIRDFRLATDRFLYHNIEENKVVEDGVFKLHFFFMNHSVPAAISVGIEVPEENKKLFFSGDFKIKGNDDRVKMDDIERFSPIDYLFLDSTGSMHQGTSENEENVKNRLEKMIMEWDGRIFITTFSSHIERIKNIYEIASRKNYSVGIQGYSIKAHLEAAFEAGELEIAPSLFRDPAPQSKKSVWLIAGCQGEPGSSFYRVAREEIDKFKLNSNDLLIYSASMIPGNEKMVMDSLNYMVQKGVTITGLSSSEFHASGHGRQEDLKKLISLLEPSNIVPIHGDHLHFYSMKNIVEDRSRFHIVDPSYVYALKKGPEKVTYIGKDITYVEEKEMHNDHSLYRKRKTMAENGVLLVMMKNEKPDVTLRYTGTSSHDFITENIERLEAEATVIIENINQSSSAKKERRIREKINQLNKKILGKEPLIELIYL